MAVTDSNFQSLGWRGVCNSCGTDIGDIVCETKLEARKIAKKRHDQYVPDCAGIPVVYHQEKQGLRKE